MCHYSKKGSFVVVENFASEVPQIMEDIAKKALADSISNNTLYTFSKGNEVLEMFDEMFNKELKVYWKRLCETSHSDKNPRASIIALPYWDFGENMSGPFSKFFDKDSDIMKWASKRKINIAYAQINGASQSSKCKNAYMLCAFLFGFPR